MKTLKLFIFLLISSFTIISCSDEAGILVNLKNVEQLEAQAGQTLTFALEFTDEDGIQQIVLESELLGLDFLENLDGSFTTVTKDFSVTIPSDATVGSTYDIDVDVSDTTGRAIQEVFEVTIIE